MLTLRNTGYTHSEANLSFRRIKGYIPFPTPDRGEDYTRFVVVNDDGTAFPLDSSRVSFREIQDGLENTGLVFECRESRIVWTEPRDVALQDAGRICQPRDLVLFADGNIARFTRQASLETIRALATIAGGESVFRKHLISNGTIEIVSDIGSTVH